MKHIYHFDLIQPPALSERTLKAELERRKTQRHTALLALAGILVNWCLIIVAIALYPINIFFSIACICYMLIAICGGGAIAAVYSKITRRKMQCLSQ